MKSMVVPRRRVRARVRLADSVYEGALYAPVEEPGGGPGRLSDRLNESQEKYIPLALENRHVLLRKASIVVVELGEEEREIEQQVTRAARELHLRFRLSDGTTLRGRTHAEMPPESARVLDFMNERAPRFITLLRDGQVLILNERHVTAVSEEG